MHYSYITHNPSHVFHSSRIFKKLGSWWTNTTIQEEIKFISGKFCRLLYFSFSKVLGSGHIVCLRPANDTNLKRENVGTSTSSLVVKRRFVVDCVRGNILCIFTVKIEFEKHFKRTQGVILSTVTCFHCCDTKQRNPLLTKTNGWFT